LPDAEDLAPVSKVAAGGVVEGVVLEGAGCVEVKAELRKARLEDGGIGNWELEFSLGVRHAVSIRLGVVVGR
jgi:hypothetical protein